MRRVVFLLVFLGAVAMVAIPACGDVAPKVLWTDTGLTALRVWEGFHHPDPERIPSELATTPGTPWGPYAGSRACQPCHDEIYQKWRGSFHSRTLYDVAAETVFGDFSGDRIFDDPTRAFIVRPYSSTDEATGRTRFYMSIRWRRPEEGGPTKRELADTYGSGVPEFEAGHYEIVYAFGNRRHQPYVARWPDGKHWVVPIYWNDVDKAWRYDGFRPYVATCGGCHVTGIKSTPEPLLPGVDRIGMTEPPRFNLPPAQEGWADGAVGCEVCHGPGRKHIEAVEALGIEVYRERLALGEKDPTIFDGTERYATLDQLISQCDQCHNFHTESTLTWFPSPTGFDREPLRRPIRPGVGDGLFQFYADGSHKSPCTIGAVYRTSKMYEKGVGCGDCHDPHGTTNWADLVLPIEDNSLCLKCHKDEFPDLAAQTAHSKHQADSPGNRCVECHMPRHLIFTNGVEMMSERIHRHSFDIPTGIQAPGGPPSACNVCHVDRDHVWTRQTIRRLWPPR